MRSKDWMEALEEDSDQSHSWQSPEKNSDDDKAGEVPRPARASLTEKQHCQRNE